MISIKIVAIGSLKEKYLVQAAEEYLKRISKFAKVSVVEVREHLSLSASNNDVTRRKESEQIEKELDGCVIVLDSGGKNISSEEFAEFFEHKQTNGTNKFCFVIGGSVGLYENIKQSADFVLSFGKMTFPHQLMRVVLLEQIYRALTINGNLTYHK